MISRIIKEAVNAVFCIIMIGVFFGVHIDINVVNIVKLSLIGMICVWYDSIVFDYPKLWIPTKNHLPYGVNEGKHIL